MKGMGEMMRRIQSLAFFLCLLMLCSSLSGVLAEAVPPVPDWFLEAHLPEFPEGMRYPVFQGPGENYLRAGDGKAVVSTRGVIQVFGFERDWLLIQYGLKAGRMRIGYIKNPGILGLSQLNWYADETSLTKPLTVTDDPLGQQLPLLDLKEGTPLRLLSTLGDWSYLEAKTSQGIFRAFAPKSELDRATRRLEDRPFDLRAVSYGIVSEDYATLRYLKEMQGRWRDSQGRPPNRWLRLDSTEREVDLQNLSDFRVVKGKASCSPLPVPVLTLSKDTWGTGYFLSRFESRRAALDLYVEEGESMDNLVIACTRTYRSPDGREQKETLSLPLSGLALDQGAPQGAVRFSFDSLAPFQRTKEQMDMLASYSILSTPYTLQGVLVDVFQPIAAPQALLSLPYDAKEAGLYRLSGRFTRPPGAYGVYDLTFALKNPPPGVYLAPYQECGSCSEISAFDLFGDEVKILRSDLMDQPDAGKARGLTMDQRMDILVLVDQRQRNQEEVWQLLKGLQVEVSFSAEKWDILYEQHMMTTAIGPRITEPVDMGNLKVNTDPVHELWPMALD